MSISTFHIEEQSAYPADCDNEYGWEKLFAERLFQRVAACQGNAVRIARFHNCYGPYETYKGGREKAPAATCRKVAEKPGDEISIDVWGDGTQIRTFMYIDDCIEGILRLMASPCDVVVNMGSEEIIDANSLAYLVGAIAQKRVNIKNIIGDQMKPTGVPFRTCDNTMLYKLIGWKPSIQLSIGMTKMYEWVKERVAIDSQD